MTQLKKMLINPLTGLEPDNLVDVKNRFKKIAKTLFENYCLKSGNKTFRFAEIEFYYYKKDKWDEEWNKVTYPRNKNAGELFFHYSGADICFQCHFDDNGKDDNIVEYGGILIRSVIEEDGDILKLHAGPQYCANLILNSCNNIFPELERAKKIECGLETAVRYGINEKERKLEEDNDFMLCFYLDNINWEEASKRIVWDTKQSKYKEMKRNYERERFSNIHKKKN